MSHDESFLRRWSRRKHESAEVVQAEPEPMESDVPPSLPPIEELGFDSDFKAFMHPKVDRETRSAALKKLFMTPHYQAMDGLDVYVGDYSAPEALPSAMLARLAHAHAMLAEDKSSDTQETEAPPASLSAQTPSEPQQDEAADMSGQAQKQA